MPLEYKKDDFDWRALPNAHHPLEGAAAEARRYFGGGGPLREFLETFKDEPQRVFLWALAATFLGYLSFAPDQADSAVAAPLLPDEGPVNDLCPSPDLTCTIERDLFDKLVLQVDPVYNNEFARPRADLDALLQAWQSQFVLPEDARFRKPVWNYGEACPEPYPTEWSCFTISMGQVERLPLYDIRLGDLVILDRLYLQPPDWFNYWQGNGVQIFRGVLGWGEQVPFGVMLDFFNWVRPDQIAAEVVAEPVVLEPTPTPNPPSHYLLDPAHYEEYFNVQRDFFGPLCWPVAIAGGGAVALFINSQLTKGAPLARSERTTGSVAPDGSRPILSDSPFSDPRGQIRRWDAADRIEEKGTIKTGYSNFLREHGHLLDDLKTPTKLVSWFLESLYALAKGNDPPAPPA